MNGSEIQDWFVDLGRFVVGTTFDRTKAFAEFQNLARLILQQQSLTCEKTKIDIERDPTQHPIDLIGFRFFGFRAFCQRLRFELENEPQRVLNTIRQVFEAFLEIVGDIGCPICGYSMNIYPGFDENCVSYACDDCGYEPDDCSPKIDQRLDNKAIEILEIFPIRKAVRWEQADERMLKLLCNRPAWIDQLGENR